MRLIVTAQTAAYAAILAVGLHLSGCTTLPRVVGEEAAAKAEVASLKAAKTALTVWSYTQDGILIYGRLPNCDPELPDMKICKDRDAWAKIKRIEAQTSATILAAKPLIEAGSNDIAFLAGVVSAVNEAIINVNEAKGYKK